MVIGREITSWRTSGNIHLVVNGSCALKQFPMQWSGSHVECTWIDHGKASYERRKRVVIVVNCCLIFIGSQSTGALRPRHLHTLTSSNHGWFWEANIIADANADLAEL
jgi:hypothetical protein